MLSIQFRSRCINYQYTEAGTIVRALTQYRGLGERHQIAQLLRDPSLSITYCFRPIGKIYVLHRHRHSSEQEVRRQEYHVRHKTFDSHCLNNGGQTKSLLKEPEHRFAIVCIGFDGFTTNIKALGEFRRLTSKFDLSDAQLCEILRNQDMSPERARLLAMLASDSRECFTSSEHNRPRAKAEALGSGIHVCEGAYASLYMEHLPGVPQHFLDTEESDCYAQVNETMAFYHFLCRSC